MIQITNCPVCGSHYSAPRTPATGHPFLNVQVDGFEIQMSAFVQYQECLECGTHYQNPRMDDETLDRWYESGTYRKWLFKPQAELDDDERIRSFGIAEWLHMEGMLIKNLRVLDIGCSRGYLLDILRSRKSDIYVQGVESNLNYVTEDVPVVRTLEEVQGQYDLITMIHVLEHASRPLEFLQKVYPLLSPGGRLVIEVPSRNSTGGPYRLAHLTFLPPPALKTLVKLAGFEVEAWIPGQHTRVVCKKGVK